MTTFQVLPMDPSIVNAYVQDLRNVRVTGFFDWDVLAMKVMVTGEPLPTPEELAAKDASMLMAAQAEQLEHIARLRKLAAWCVALAKQPDSDQYSSLKNAGQRQKWLVAHGAMLKDVPDIVDLLTPEMTETTKKLAAEAQL